MGLDFTILSAALLVTAAVAFTRQRRMVLVVCAGLFVVVAALASVDVYWPVSPAFTVVLLAVTLGLPLLTHIIYAVDLVFTPFGSEMSWPAMICWLLWPVLVVANVIGLLLV